MPSFQLVGLAYKPFSELFALNETELSARGAIRLVADANIGFPCRVSLHDARAGEELILLSYEHLPGPCPYRATGPIFVRKDATRNFCKPDTVPDYVSRRLISLRAYHGDDMMQAAEVYVGTDVADAISRHFLDRRIAYIHLHNATRGCFSCRADRC